MKIPPVVVGVDGTPESLVAVDLAAAEATLRGTGLYVVNAANASALDAGQRLVDEARAHAARRSPAVPVTVAVVVGSPADVLGGESRGAALLVVGRRGHGLARIRSTSVVAHIAARAECPVLVAQGVSEAATNILVGIGDGAPTGEALAFAFAEADLRRTGVTAIHAWRSPVLAGHGVAGGYGVAREIDDNNDAARVLSEALAGWRNRYPDIEVRRVVPEGGAADALVQASVWAQMLVVGAPRGRLSPMIHDIVQHALCPVAIVPA